MMRLPNEMAPTDATATIPTRLRRAFHALRTEGSGIGRETAAIASGVFIGCTPFYGFHLAICWVVGTIFRLNRVKMYFASNISNPFVAPWLIVAELQTGAWLRHGELRALSARAIGAAGVGAIGVDLLLGSLVIGGMIAAAAGVATYATLRSSCADPVFMDLVRRAADRYIGTSITAWEFARGKLRGDSVYHAALFGRLLPSGGTIVDIGCGQGLMLALLAEARRATDAGVLPASSPTPPRFDRMIGLDVRPRVAALASAALGAEAEVATVDARGMLPGPARAILLFDVLHLIDAAGQEALLAGAKAALESDGVVLVREADAAAGWRFRAVWLGNRLKALSAGAWSQRFCFRSRTEWLRCFAALGFDVDVPPTHEAPSSANLLFRLTVKRH